MKLTIREPPRTFTRSERGDRRASRSRPARLAVGFAIASAGSPGSPRLERTMTAPSKSSVARVAAHGDHAAQAGAGRGQQPVSRVLDRERLPGRDAQPFEGELVDRWIRLLRVDGIAGEDGKLRRSIGPGACARGSRGPTSRPTWRRPRGGGPTRAPRRRSARSRGVQGAHRCGRARRRSQSCVRGAARPTRARPSGSPGSPASCTSAGVRAASTRSFPPPMRSFSP